MAMFVPLIGAAVQGIQAKNAADTNAKIQGYEASTAAAQGYSAEATQRRQGSMQVDKMTAASGQAGAGYQGSVGRSIGQSAQNDELNDLNIRYRAGLQKWGYQTQAGFTQQQGNDALASSALRAGSALLMSSSNSYLTPNMLDAGNGLGQYTQGLA